MSGGEPPAHGHHDPVFLLKQEVERGRRLGHVPVVMFGRRSLGKKAVRAARGIARGPAGDPRHNAERRSASRRRLADASRRVNRVVA